MPTLGGLGARIHNNFMGAVQADKNLLNHIANNAIAASSMQPGRDFVQGITTGRAPTVAALPTMVSNAQAKAPAAAAGRVPTLNDLPVWAGDGLRGTPFTLDPAFAKQNKGANAVVIDPDTGAVARPTLAAAASGPQSFDDTISRFAQAAGGMSLNELAVLSDVSAKTRKSVAAPTKQADLQIQKFDALSQQQYDQSLADAIKKKDKVAVQSAARQRMTDIASTWKSNPFDQNIAPQTLPQE